MDTLILFLIFLQALGAFIGVVMAIWGEFAYIRAMRDKNIDFAERAHINYIARGLRFGMTILLLSSFALVVVAFMSHSAPQPAMTSSYWIFNAIALLAIWVSFALSKQNISFALGSATILSAWWILFYLTLGFLPANSFGSAVALFVVLTAVIYAALHYLRMLILHKR